MFKTLKEHPYKFGLLFVYCASILFGTLHYFDKLIRRNNLINESLLSWSHHLVAVRVLPKLTEKLKGIAKAKLDFTYVPPEGKIVIKPKDPSKKLEDLVEVNYKWYGLSFRPGLQLAIIPMGLGLDAKLIFVNRFGLNAGGIFLIQSRTITPTLGLSYRLDKIKFIYNTEFQCSYIPIGLIPVACGVRVNL